MNDRNVSLKDLEQTGQMAAADQMAAVGNGGDAVEQLGLARDGSIVVIFKHDLRALQMTARNARDLGRQLLDLARQSERALQARRRR